MKKEYEAPKADRMEFNYAETVVASTSSCDEGTFMTQATGGSERCTSVPSGPTQYMEH